MAAKFLSTVVNFILASMLVFLLLEATPGNVAAKQLGPWASEASKEVLFKELQLDAPLLERYAKWVGILAGVIPDPLAETNLGYTDPRGAQYFGNFGFSHLYKRPVNDIVWQRLTNTLLLAGVALPAIVALSFLIGTIAGLNEARPVDGFLSFFCILLTSVPEFVSGTFLIVMFVVLLGWLPALSNLDTTQGWSLWAQLVMPVAVITLYNVGYIARIVRTSTAAVVRMPYVRTAILKGLPFRRVVLSHILRNAMIAPMTVILLQISWLITGVVVTEVVFNYPGFGRLLYDAALFGDIALLEAAAIISLFVASATQLSSDVLYRWLDPRVAA